MANSVISYPDNITKSVYMTFTRKYSRGLKTSELRSITNGNMFATKATSLIALPVPNNLSDSSTINYSDVQDTSLLGMVVDKIAQQAGQTVVQQAKMQTGTTKTTQQVLLFDSVSLKNFSFSWELIPENKNEANNITNIIKEFEEAKLPTYTSGFEALRFPDVFSIKIKGSSNGIIKYLPSVLTGVEVQYSDGHYNEYKNGGFPKVTLNLSFSEIVSRTREVQKRLYNGA